MQSRNFARRKTRQANAGFTLLELLVAIAVLGILAAIAFQEFNKYRSHAIDAQMRTALKNAAVAMESYFAEYQSYRTSVGSILSAGFRQTSGLTLNIVLISPSSFTLTASKPSGTQASFSFDSSTGLIN
jgi:prepilin-type N-terminal cleavage/methylation domain-containing protein